MKLIVNGKEQRIEESAITVGNLLEINKVKMPDMVSVQLNQEFLAREKFRETILNENDQIDFLYFMGGG